MRITKAADYAIRCVLFLSESDDKQVSQRVRIAEAMDIPAHFLAKIVQKLAVAGIVRIARGPAGGCQLIKTPDDVTLLDVIEAVDGRIIVSDCLMGSGICSRERKCPIRSAWTRIGGNLRKQLGSVTFASLIENSTQRSTSGENDK